MHFGGKDEKRENTLQINYTLGFNSKFSRLDDFMYFTGRKQAVAWNYLYVQTYKTTKLCLRCIPRNRIESSNVFVILNLLFNYGSFCRYIHT